MYRRYRILTRGLLAITPRKELTELQFWENQHQQPHPKVAESENIGANHLGFAKFLFQHYSESAFNFYINERIVYLLRTSINIELVRETFYNKLIQNTSLPTNHNFASIITEINKEIEHHIQQRYPITYTSKGKEKLQTPAVIPQKIQPPTWKKTRIESPTNPSYHYIPGSAINITSTRLQSPLSPPNFGTATLWELSEEEEQEKKEEKSEDQEFTYQNPIPENPEFETPNNQTLRNPNQKNPKIETPNFQT
ncbi:hypothetical protein G9A89_002905 [Geosiphon pyriformis]|nr:hypothetical protein G9A89_002905 [Geosiphon pyriformis]